MTKFQIYLRDSKRLANLLSDLSPSRSREAMDVWTTKWATENSVLREFSLCNSDSSIFYAYCVSMNHQKKDTIMKIIDTFNKKGLHLFDDFSDDQIDNLFHLN